MAGKDTWGPILWDRIHELSLREDERAFITLIRNLPKIVPCPECREHSKRYLKAHPITKSTNLLRWGIDFHNTVNKRLGKRVLPYSKAELLIRRKSAQTPYLVSEAKWVVQRMVYL